jgi:NAD(P)H dehydrogenase (quinone)
MTTYAIAAATGRYGSAAVKYLVSKVSADDTVIAVARNAEKARATVPAGVEIRAGDYTNPEEMVTALKGVDRFLLVSSPAGGVVTRPQQHLNAINAAKQNGVRYIAYTSFAKADTAKAPLAQDHQATEALLKESDVEYSVLRNAWYLENDAAVFKAAAQGKPLVYSAGEGRISWAPEDEYAEAGVNILMSDSQKTVYEFGGKPRTFADIAALLADITGHDIDVHQVSDAEYAQGLAAKGMPDGVVQLLTSFQTMMRDGELDVDSSDLEEALGHPSQDFREALEHAIA